MITRYAVAAMVLKQQKKKQYLYPAITISLLQVSRLESRAFDANDHPLQFILYYCPFNLKYKSYAGHVLVRLTVYRNFSVINRKW